VLYSRRNLDIFRGATFFRDTVYISTLAGSDFGGRRPLHNTYV